MVKDTKQISAPYSLKDVLSEQEIDRVLKTATGEEGAQLIEWELNVASPNLVGFLAEHLRATLRVQVGDEVKAINLFIKCLPIVNKPRAKFIAESNIFRRELLMYTLFEDLGGSGGTHPWHPKGLFYNESVLVMPDLATEGYSLCSNLETFDLQQTLLTAASTARFHAAFANYQTRKSSGGLQYNILDDHGDILTEAILDTPGLHVATARLMTDFMGIYCTENYKIPSDYKIKILKFIQREVNSLKAYDNTLNVVIHKDLWVTNVMFAYQEGVANNAMLMDFQLVRYAPPAYDLMIMLHMCTTCSFRAQHEKDILRHYFSIFTASLDSPTQKRLVDLKYDYQEFLKWCNKARRFGATVACLAFPYTLMQGCTLHRDILEDPGRFMDDIAEDKAGPVLIHAKKHDLYRQRLLDVFKTLTDMCLIE